MLCPLWGRILALKGLPWLGLFAFLLPGSWEEGRYFSNLLIFYCISVTIHLVGGQSQVLLWVLEQEESYRRHTRAGGPAKLFSEAQQSFPSLPKCSLETGERSVAVQSFSLVWLFVTPWTAACQASLSFTMSQSLLRLMSTELAMLSNHLILNHFLLFLPSIFPSVRVFSNELALCIRWPKYWSFSFSISPSSEYSVLTSFGTYWFDHRAFQRTLKSLLQHRSSKTSILWHSFFFMAQFSYLSMTTRKTTALTIWTEKDLRLS